MVKVKFFAILDIEKLEKELNDFLEKESKRPGFFLNDIQYNVIPISTSYSKYSAMLVYGVNK